MQKSSFCDVVLRSEIYSHVSTYLQYTLKALDLTHHVVALVLPEGPYDTEVKPDIEHRHKIALIASQLHVHVYETEAYYEKFANAIEITRIANSRALFIMPDLGCNRFYNHATTCEAVQSLGASICRASRDAAAAIESKGQIDWTNTIFCTRQSIQSWFGKAIRKSAQKYQRAKVARTRLPARLSLHDSFSSVSHRLTTEINQVMAFLISNRWLLDVPLSRNEDTSAVVDPWLSRADIETLVHLGKSQVAKLAARWREAASVGKGGRYLYDYDSLRPLLIRDLPGLQVPESVTLAREVIAQRRRLESGKNIYTATAGRVGR